VWDDPDKIDLASIGYINAYKARRRQTIETLLSELPPPARVLDLAAAQGNFTAALAGLGYRVTWNDLRGELGDYARQKLPADSGVEFVAGNIFELGDAHVGRYDAVVALEVIEHVAHPDQFMAKLATLLRPGGVLVMSTPNGGYFLNTLPRFSDHPDPSVFESTQFKPNSDGHIFLLHEDELRRFAQSCGLEVRRLETFTNPLTAGHIKLRYALRVLPGAIVDAVEWLTRRLPAAIRRRLSAHTIMVVRKPAG
jgi:2-polyprenyl-6-hydroxyphenyl methylase/3-demethylubiquinone-9 3-methyltransferase